MRELELSYFHDAIVNNIPLESKTILITIPNNKRETLILLRESLSSPNAPSHLDISFKCESGINGAYGVVCHSLRGSLTKPITIHFDNFDMKKLNHIANAIGSNLYPIGLTLDLEGNKPNQRSLEAMCNAIGRCNNPFKLILQNNNLNQTKVINTFCKIKYPAGMIFDLSNNSIGNAAFDGLLKMIKRCGLPLSLILNYTGINGDALKSLAQAISSKSLPAGCSFDLSLNPISEKAADNLTETINNLTFMAPNYIAIKLENALLLTSPEKKHISLKNSIYNYNIKSSSFLISLILSPESPLIYLPPEILAQIIAPIIPPFSELLEAPNDLFYQHIENMRSRQQLTHLMP